MYIFREQRENKKVQSLTSDTYGGILLRSRSRVAVVEVIIPKETREKEINGGKAKEYTERTRRTEKTRETEREREKGDKLKGRDRWSKTEGRRDVNRRKENVRTEGGRNEYEGGKNPTTSPRLLEIARTSYRKVTRGGSEIQGLISQRLISLVSFQLSHRFYTRVFILKFNPL